MIIGTCPLAGGCGAFVGPAACARGWLSCCASRWPNKRFHIVHASCPCC